jgi:hypothetical protein
MERRGDHTALRSTDNSPAQGDTMAPTQLSVARTAKPLDNALLRAELGDRKGFATAVRSVAPADLGALHEQLNARTRAGRVDPLDAAVALFDIFSAKRAS